MTTLKHILVGTDFSEASRAAVTTARNYASALGARLTVLHVYPPQVDALGPAAARVERMHLGRAVHETLGQLMDRTSGIAELHAEVLSGEHAAPVLCEYAKNNGVDLIIVGSRGMTGLRRLLIGSVADRVVTQASCAVMVAH